MGGSQSRAALALPLYGVQPCPPQWVSWDAEGRLGTAERCRQGAAGQHSTHLPAQEQGAKSLQIWLGLTPWAGVTPSQGAAAHTRLFQPMLLALGSLLSWVCHGLWALPGDRTVTVTDLCACCHRDSGTGTAQPPLGEQSGLHRVNPHEFT